eukprot:m.558915 g.558915  ORF g.558915 m.558915 type:complete len:54 (-) comp22202_c0_seq3:205-366(-)
MAWFHEAESVARDPPQYHRTPAVPSRPLDVGSSFEIATAPIGHAESITCSTQL